MSKRPRGSTSRRTSRPSPPTGSNPTSCSCDSAAIPVGADGDADRPTWRSTDPDTSRHAPARTGHCSTPVSSDLLRSVGWQGNSRPAKGLFMTVRVGINGFGRIGRNFFRAAKARGADIDFVAANDLGSARRLMAHLLQVRHIHGRLGRRRRGRSTTASRSTATRSRSSPSATRRSCRGATSASTSSSSPPASSPRRTRPAPTSRPARRWSSCRRPPPAPTPPSWSASTTTPSTRRTTRSCPTPRARRTASCRWSRSSTTPSASRRA